jgi:hypothetical protein
MSNQVCSTKRLYHYLFNPDEAVISSICEQGLRPLSDFPESPRWEEIQNSLPGVFEWIYREFAEPILQKPYINSGVFLSPINFRLMPGSLMYESPRFVIPVERIDPEWSCLTYVIDDQRISLHLTAENLQRTADLWTYDLVERWFAVDKTKVFFYVPQVVSYQPEGIPVQPGEYEYQEEHDE